MYICRSAVKSAMDDGMGSREERQKPYSYVTCLKCLGHGMALVRPDKTLETLSCFLNMRPIKTRTLSKMPWVGLSSDRSSCLIGRR